MKDSRAPAAALGRLRVLHADDDAAFRDAFAAALASLAWIELVGAARDGVEAVDLCGALLPDLVVLDIVMPRYDGIEAMRRIHARHPQTRVLIVSNVDDPRLYGVGMSYGAAGCVRKDALMSAVTALGLLRPAAVR